jgi:hypothetical protein
VRVETPRVGDLPRLRHEVPADWNDRPEPYTTSGIIDNRTVRSRIRVQALALEVKLLDKIALWLRVVEDGFDALSGELDRP